MTTVIKKKTFIERGIITRSISPNITVKQKLNQFLEESNSEKNDLGKLNSKLGVYLSRAKSLENDNSNLMRHIFDMQSTWGNETRCVREQYEQNLFDARGRIDDMAHLKTIAEIRTKRADYEKDQNQQLMDDLHRANQNDKEKIKNLENKLLNSVETKETLRAVYANEINEIEHLKQKRDQTWTKLMSVLDDLDNEMLRRIAVEYNNQTLCEHIDFVKQINQRELIEMEQLSKVLPFNEQIEFYKNQLKNVVSSIRRDYSNINAEQSREMEEWMSKKKEELEIIYNDKDPIGDLKLSMQLDTIETLREEYDSNARQLNDLKKQNEMYVKRLKMLEEHLDIERIHCAKVLDEKRTESVGLDSEITNLLSDYNHLNSNKAALEYEMQVYKRLLDANSH